MSENFAKMRDGMFSLFKDDAAYDVYLSKFEQKKTTDDTFTPEDVYDCVAAYVRDRFGFAEDVEFIRPFYPGGDFETDWAYNRERYAAGVVVDNPPFSILCKIVDFYRSRGVRFFLFGPYLTIMGVMRNRPNVSVVFGGDTITFTNGAGVNIAYVHNMDADIIAETAPALNDAIRACASQNTTKTLPVIRWPRNILRQSDFGSLSHVPFSVRRNEALLVIRIGGRDIFGGGLLVSDVAVERAEQAEQAERAERAELVINVSLTKAEADLLKRLNHADK